MIKFSQPNSINKKLIVTLSIIFLLTSCTTTPPEEDPTLDGGGAISSTEEQENNDTPSESLEEEVLDDTPANTADNPADQPSEDLDKQTVQTENNDQGHDLNGELDVADNAGEEKVQEQQGGVEEQVINQQSQEPPAAEVTNVESTPVVESTPAPVTQPIQVSSKKVTITGVKFRPNDQGGTLLIEASGEIHPTSRLNQQTNQLVVEIPGAILPEKYKRQLNTKDIRGTFGAIDAYQNSASASARFVVQLRDGMEVPTIQLEGNNLLIVASELGAKESDPDINNEMNNPNILASYNLSEFLSGNVKFYGKKISLEVNNMDVRDALKFISEESGVNLVISDDVKGQVSLKLREVPWDQALVVMMKATKLGYTRQGNVLRIAPIASLKEEEDDAHKLNLAKKNQEPLVVKLYPVNYAKVDDLEKKIKDFLTERGKVVGDNRTNSIVVTDTEENLNHIEKLIQSLDVQPPQILIEGKIVEATETFTREMGINWGLSGSQFDLGSTSKGPLNMRPTFSVNPGTSKGGAFDFGLSIGTLDVLGNLNAVLSLDERNEKVKVISSPRILTLTNEKAEISQTTEVPVKSVNVVNGNTIQSYQFKPLSLKLEVVPQVTTDSTIVMKVNVNRQFKGASEDNGEAFSVNSREANTKVLVKNGQTAVIGGIYKSDATEGNGGVPWFKDLPGIGGLFRHSKVNNDKSELIIFLTPRIVGQGEGHVKTE